MKLSRRLFLFVVLSIPLHASAEVFEYHHAIKGLAKSNPATNPEESLLVNYYRAYPNINSPYTMSPSLVGVQNEVEYVIDDYAKFKISSGNILSIYLRQPTHFKHYGDETASGINGYVIELKAKSLAGVLNNSRDRDWEYRVLPSGHGAAVIQLGGYATSQDQDLNVPVAEAQLIFAE